MKQILPMIFSVLLFSSCHKGDGNNEIELPAKMGANIRMLVGGTTFTVSLYNNPTADAILAMLPITMNMKDMGSNEKYHDLLNALPSADVRPGTIRCGDIMLYGSSTIVLFYETFSTSYGYTRIGQIVNVAGLKTALGAGSVTITFELE